MSTYLEVEIRWLASDELTGPRVSEGAEQRREDPAIMVVWIDDGPADECVRTGRPRKVVEELYSRGSGLPPSAGRPPGKE